MMALIFSLCRHARPLILDGALATELERAGYDLDDPLWSGRLLLDNPAAIAAVHRAYLEAGADCIETASYQLSLPGLQRRGLSRGRAMSVLADAARLACSVRDDVWAGLPAAQRRNRIRPLVAGSLGPYGACQADGSEYTGRYALSRSQYLAFHAPRMRALAAGGADLIACETVPHLDEALAFADLLQALSVPGWVSFSVRDAAHIADGTPLRLCVQAMASCPSVVAIGINCTDPALVPALIRCLRRGGLPVIVYPNAGEPFDPVTRCWGERRSDDWAEQARSWLRLGARIVGGCCRTRPDDIRALRRLISAQA
ncbi:Homocysteine S-methyltransferase [Granulibacter bethesdensis]|uniref:S-methylmethionine:homocysteine methyltransferase n=2 Tax=Granulibacter bethesdensis TaxID=364410 RepID=A0AAN0RFJ9_9PROT|nr:Homocysteine S-methyltransferase [Granulibacter bethesdensis]